MIAATDLSAVTDLFWQFATVFLRVGAALSLLPAFGERSVPVRVRLALAVVFTLAVGPAAVAAGVPLPGFTPGLILGETLVGLALGLALRLFVLALQTAGAIAAQATSLSQLLGGTGEPTPALGHVLVVAGLAVAVTAGLHVRAVEYLLLSYDLIPAGTWPDATALSGWGVARIGRAFALAFQLAAPFVIVSVVYNLTLGIINRAMPQLMVAFVGAPAVTMASLLILFVSAPVMLDVWLGAMMAALGDPAGLPK